jgi:hypothetical protein
VNPVDLVNGLLAADYVPPEMIKMNGHVRSILLAIKPLSKQPLQNAIPLIEANFNLVKNARSKWLLHVVFVC